MSWALLYSIFELRHDALSALTPKILYYFLLKLNFHVVLKAFL